MQEMPATGVEPATEVVSYRPILAVGAALGLGWLADQLLWQEPWGLSVVAGIGAIVVVTVGLSGQPWRSHLWAVPALLFAAAFAWRDNLYLLLLDGLAIALALTMPYWRPVRWRRLSGTEAAAGLARAGGHLAFAALPLVFSDVRWSVLGRAGAMRRAAGIGGGLLIALPAVMVFGGLFVAADAGFESLVRGVVRFDMEKLILHGIVIAFIAWLAAGYLRGLLPGAPWQAAVPVTPFRLGLVEATTVIAVLDCLFAVFVAMQLPYLFGGTASAEALSYATYARRGFFELATVIALALPLLWALHALTAARHGTGARVFTALSAVWVLLLGVIIASAAHRMLLYQAAYGLTELRVYVLAFELWTAVLLAWFAWTVLRGRGDRFVIGLVAWAYLGLAAMHLPNWQARIAAHNITLSETSEAVDAGYLYTLGADAVPTLLAMRGRLPEAARYRLATILLDRRGHFETADWRSWNWSRWQAGRAIALEAEALRADARKDDPAWPY